MGLKAAYREAVRSIEGGDGRLPLLVNDMVIEEQLCHLRCTYCLTEEFNLLMAVPDAADRLRTDRRHLWHAALDAYQREVDAPVLRVSGGELLWLPGSDEFLAEAAAHYETVQVITNGVLLKPERLARLREISNLQLNISLDGHTAELNGHRFPNPRMFDVVLAHLDEAVDLGFPVEIQAVLTELNASAMPEYCDFLVQRYGDAVRLYFFPIRGEIAGSLASPASEHLRQVCDRYDEWAAVLPPRAFVEHMATYMAQGSRTLPCSVPATMMQLFGDGAVSACPHAWLTPTTELGEEGGSIADAFGQHPHYDLFLQPRPRLSYCRTCATPSDVVNLYLQGSISDAEIGRCFLYSGPRTLQRLAALRAAFLPITSGFRTRNASRRIELSVVSEPAAAEAGGG